MSIGVDSWHAMKEWLRHASGWPMDTLHILAGVAIQLLVAAMLRTSIADRRPWLAVLALAAVNEAHDLWLEAWPSRWVQMGEGLHDLISTLFLPTVLLLTARRFPRLLVGRR